MKTPQVLAFILATTLPCLAEPQHPDQPARIAEGLQPGFSGDFETSIEGAWASRYIAEGREVFGENGVMSALAILSYQSFAVELWQGWSDGSADREFQGSLQCTLIDEPVSVTFGLTHINDTRGGDDDLDASVSISAPLPNGIAWDTEFYYGFDRDGFYLETGFSKTWETRIVDVTLGAHLGSNYGYVMDGHEGPDHYVISANLSRAINDCFRVTAGVSQHLVIDRDTARNAEDGELYDGTVFGFAAEYSF